MSKELRPISSQSFQDRLAQQLVKKPAPRKSGQHKLRKSQSNGRDEEQ